MNPTRSRSARRALAALSVALLVVPLSGQNPAIAIGETPSAGTVSGSYADTHAADGVYEAITERVSGGRPSNRTSYLTHIWHFDVSPGTSVTLFIKAYHTANTEADDFRLLWSSDGASYEPLLDLTETSAAGSYRSAVLPGMVSGPLWVAVVDLDRTAGNLALDTVFVDHLYVESAAGGPPPQPADVVAIDSSSRTIDITWTDLSADEDGFVIERSDGVTAITAGIVGPNETYLRDFGLLPSTTYHYVVYAFSANGLSPPSNPASATTRDPGAFAVDRVDVLGYAPNYKDLAYDPLTGHPAIAYWDSVANRITLAQWNGATWHVDDVADGVEVSLAFSPLGTTSIAHASGGTLTLSERAGTVWSSVEIDGRASAPSLAYDSYGEPAIAYRTQRGNNGALKLARRSNGSWSTETVVDGFAHYISLAFDSQGRAAIAYATRSSQHSGTDSMNFARRNGPSWELELIESGVAGWGVFCSLAFDPTTGWPAITHGNAGEVRFLRWNGTSWQVEVIGGWNARLAYDVFGNAHIAYFDASLVRLEVARWDGVAMQPELVSVVGENLSHLPIALRIDPSTQLPSVTWSDSWGVGFARK